MHAIDTPVFTRRAFLAGTSTAALSSLLLTGCSSRQSRLIVLLDDISGSRRQRDRADQLVTINNLVSSLQPAEETAAADKLVLAAIGDASLSEFSATTSATITYIGRPDRNRQITAARQKLVETINSTEPLATSQETRIFDAIAGAAEILAADLSRRPELCILSDMIEDSPIARFARAVPTDRGTHDILARLSDQHLIPDLKGAKISVTGGGGRDGAAYEAIKNFWQAYFAKAKGTLVTYTRSPLEFAAETEKG